MATFYVKTYADGGRDESGRNGSVGQEWATPSYASGRVTTSGDVIDIASGNYTDNGHFVLVPGVTAVGKVVSRPNIFTSYSVSSSYDGYVRMYSSSQTNGNQSISYINFVGNSLACARAIYIQYRDNVTIHHCNIDDFLAAGIFFNNEETWNAEPNNLALDCSIHHCNITNCSDRNYDPEALLRLKGMKNLTCYSNVLINNERSAGQNGNIISASFLENCKFHDNQYFKNDYENGEWNFFVELFHPRGGTEFYNETFFGAATLDLGGAPNFGAERGTYDYSLSIHHCTFTTSTGAQLSVRNGTEPNGKHHMAIDLETNLEYVYVYNNRIRHYAIGVALVTSTLSQIYNQNHVYIYNNIMEDMGYSSYQYNYGIYVNNEGNPVVYSGTTDNLHIWNNVINGAGNNSHGIIWHMRGTCTNSSIKNNIITGFDTTAVTISRQIDAGDTLYLTNVLVNYNDFYGNGNNSVVESGITGKTSCNFTTGNITNNPLFVDSDFNLNQTSSPCLYTGITVAINYDYNGNPWATPNPSMGVYEYGTGFPPSLLTGIRAWWKGTEQSGTIIQDSTANDFDGNTSGSPTLGAAGIINYAIEFDGVDDVVNCATSVGDIGYNDLSISCWVYLVSSVNSQNGILGNWGDEPYFYANFNESDYFRFRIGMSGTEYEVILSDSPASIGTWYHLVLRLDRDGDMDMYINDVKQTATVNISDYSGIDMSNSNNFNLGNIGSALSGYFGKIRLCHIGIYPRLLSEAEITLLYGSGNAFDYPFTGGAKGSVPDIVGIKLSDVITCIEPSVNSLGGCFNDSVDVLFDPTYKGSKDRLSNFRNYNG